MGAMARQGPHHVAQKSTNTGVSHFRTSWSKFESVTSKIALLAINSSSCVSAASQPKQSQAGFILTLVLDAPDLPNHDWIVCGGSHSVNVTSVTRQFFGVT